MFDKYRISILRRNTIYFIISDNDTIYDGTFENTIQPLITQVLPLSSTSTYMRIEGLSIKGIFIKMF